MTMNADSVVLTERQAACLDAVKGGRATKTMIALEARLDLRETSRALEKLERLGLVERCHPNRWRASAQTRDRDVTTVPGRMRRGRDKLPPAGLRLLEVLNRPMSGTEIAQRLGTSRQRVQQLLVRLHGRGHVRFGDPEETTRIVARSDDPTLLLEREEQRVLSAISSEFATNVRRIRRVANTSAAKLQEILARLIDGGLVAEVPEGGSVPLYRVTATGLQHPQYDRCARRAEPPPSPVRSDRVLAVLSEIRANGQARIRDLRVSLGIPQQSINALVQYLKRKSLVEKAGQDFHAPYRLTERGCGAVDAMIRQRAAAPS